ncbi:MAG: DedA family protein [bacterium]
MSISALLLEFAVQLIDKIGYFGVSLILIIDNAGVPIPSEAVLALSGAAARAGRMNIPVVIFLGVTMQTLGSCLAYWIGHIGGGPMVKKYGKYLLISAEDYDKTQDWFAQHGPRAIFISRLTPVVRTFMGFAAGAAKMEFGPFVIQSLAGSAVWTIIWCAMGYAVGESWHTYYEYMHYVDYVVVIGLVILIGRFMYHRLSKGSKKGIKHGGK